MASYIKNMFLHRNCFVLTLFLKIIIKNPSAQTNLPIIYYSIIKETFFATKHLNRNKDILLFDYSWFLSFAGY